MSRAILADVLQKTSTGVPRQDFMLRGRLTLVGCVVAVAHLPLLLLHGRMLWAREHYQFFPLLAPAAGFLIYQRLAEFGPLTPGRATISYLLFGLAWAGLALAIVLFSPWLGAVAAQLVLLACTYCFGGRSLVRCLLPAWVLLWLAVPLPNEFDARLIAWLQQLTTVGASLVLEVLGVLHLRTGTILILGDRRLLVEEACSGVHSFFSMLACVLFWVAWQRRPLLHGMLLVLSVVPWVLIGNVARILAVATLDGKAGLNLGEGWGHEALGFILFAGMLLLVWSTDHLLRLLTPVGQLPWGEILQSILFPFRHPSGMPAKAAKPAQSTTAPLEDNPPARQELGPSNAILRMGPVVTGYSLLILVEVGLLYVRLSTSGESITFLATGGLPAETVRMIEAWDEKTMPENVGAWKRSAFQAKERVPDNPLGRFSRTWRYQNEHGSAALGIFYPFLGWKDSTRCYVNQGWVVLDHQFDRADPNKDPGGYVFTRMYHSVEPKYGLLFMHMRNGRGQALVSSSEVPVPKWFQHRIASAWRSQNPSEETDLGYLMPTYQLQLLVESPARLSPPQEQEVEGLRQQMLQTLRK